MKINDFIAEFKYLTKDYYVKDGYAKKLRSFRIDEKYVIIEKMKDRANLKKYIIIFAHTKIVYHQKLYKFKYLCLLCEYILIMIFIKVKNQPKITNF